MSATMTPNEREPADCRDIVLNDLASPDRTSSARLTPDRAAAAENNSEDERMGGDNSMDAAAQVAQTRRSVLSKCTTSKTVSAPDRAATSAATPRSFCASVMYRFPGSRRAREEVLNRLKIMRRPRAPRAGARISGSSSAALPLQPLTR